MSLEFILKNSPLSADIPESGQLAAGEIALNYHSDGCFLTCVDTEGEVRTLGEVWVNEQAPTAPQVGRLWFDKTKKVLNIWLSDQVQWFAVGSGVGPEPGGGVQSISVIPNGGVFLSGTAANPVLSVDTTVVRTSGDQTISGLKTFQTGIKGNLEGNASTASIADSVNQNVLAGAGLTGGGQLTRSVTLAVLPATKSTIGGVKQGAGTAIASDGTISVDVTPGNQWLGTIDVGSQDPPETPPSNGSYYINTVTALARTSWIGIAGTQCFDGNYIIWNSKAGLWENAGTIIGGGVEEIKAGSGIAVQDPKSSAPTVSVDGTIARSNLNIFTGTGLTGGGTLASDITIGLTKASQSNLGGVIVGSGLQIQDGVLSADIPNVLVFKGSVAVDTDSAPPSPAAGWAYISKTQAIANETWVGIAGKTIPSGELIVFDGTNWAESGNIGTVGVESILAGPGITVLDPNSSAPTVQVNDQVVQVTGDVTINGEKTFTKTIVGDISGNASSADTATQADVSAACTKQVLATNGLSGGGALTADVVLQCDNTVVRTIGNQTLDGTKKFLKAIQGNLNGNADTATNAQFSERAVLADTLDKSIVPGDGLQGGGKFLTDVDIAVDTSVLRDFGNQDIDGTKKFLKGIQGNLNGNADTATNAQFAQQAVLAKTLDLSILAGDGLSGGGLLTTNQTLAVDASVVRTAGDQTLDGNKKFLKAIQGNLNGNADTATNAVNATNCSRNVIASGGLTGGGTLNADVTIGLNATGVTAGTYTSATITVDAYGRITAAKSDSGFPAGTRMVFCQSSAPSGWTQVTDGAFNDAALRVVTSSGGGTGGSISFSSFFSSSSTYSGKINLSGGSVGSTTLTVAQLASHGHGFSPGTVTAPVGQYSATRGNQPLGNVGTSVSANGSSQGHSHTFDGAVADGSFTTNFSVKYVTTIICEKQAV